ncbi:MAG: L-lysine 6-transaminase [Planctomycetes bacterium]|nr:L-lysine 6-transaminase [Planctomycetota bacterium]
MQTYQTSADSVLSKLGQYILVDGFHIVIDLEKSHGNYIVDANTGKEYLDMYSYFASLPLGHNHPKVVGDEEFKKAILRAALANPTNSDIYAKEFAYFVDKFGKLTLPEGFNHMFFIAGGGLAVENALKASFDWKVQKNIAKGIGETKGMQAIHFTDAFHGRTGYTMSLTNTDPTKTKWFPQFDWPRIINPKLRFPITDEVIKEVAAKEEQAFEQIRKAFADNPDDIAAIIIEPIQGEGGDNHFRAEFFQGLRKLADEFEAMLIVDEVQTGGGSTGKFWAFEHFGFTPDIICFGKKTQVCGIMANSRIDEVENNVFSYSGRINSTWGGNLVDMLRGMKYAEIIREDNLLENAAKVGAHFVSKLREFGEKYPNVMSNVRGRGLFMAFDCVSTEARDEMRTICFDNGLATLAAGTKTVRFRPGLNLSMDEANFALETLEKAIKIKA